MMATPVAIALVPGFQLQLTKNEILSRMVPLWFQGEGRADLDPQKHSDSPAGHFTVKVLVPADLSATKISTW